MWRDLLEYTDTAGRALVGFAAHCRAAGGCGELRGGCRAGCRGNAPGTLPFWLTTMGCAVLAGVLVYLASRRADIRRH
ncbi:hypothetical protein [Leifsonia xyli]|uniref:hypothetical protein n=1 Tax=Leifsonia xyli TaxID=1575 RepID=UPI000A968E0D|nr:hypothetical protein [Leifsonia xyli]